MPNSVSFPDNRTRPILWTGGPGFKEFHSEKVFSAIERYNKKVNRMLGVLDGYLTQQKQEHGGSSCGFGPWLVSDKFSYADIEFIPW